MPLDNNCVRQDSNCGSDVMEEINGRGHRRAVPSCTLPIYSIAEHDAQEGVVDLQAAVVVDEPELPELVHEEIEARAGVEKLVAEVVRVQIDANARRSQIAKGCPQALVAASGLAVATATARAGSRGRSTVKTQPSPRLRA